MKNLEKLLTSLFVILILVNYYSNAAIRSPSKTLSIFAHDQLVFDLLKSQNPVSEFYKINEYLPLNLTEELKQELFDSLTFSFNHQYELLHEFRVHDTNVLSICISPDNKIILTGGSDSCVKVWTFDGKFCQFFQSLPGHFFKKGSARISSLLISFDKELIVSGSIDDDSINIWKFDGQNYKHFQSLSCRSWVLSISMSKDKQHIIAGCDDTLIHGWHFNGIRYEECSPVEDTHLYPGYVEFSPDINAFVSLSTIYFDRALYLWRNNSTTDCNNYSICGEIQKQCTSIGLSLNGEDLAVRSNKQINLFRFCYDSLNYRLFKKISFCAKDATFYDDRFIRLPCNKPLLIVGGLNCPTRILKFANITKKLRGLPNYYYFCQRFIEIEDAPDGEIELVGTQTLPNAFSALVGDISSDSKFIVLGFVNGSMQIWRQISFDELGAHFRI